MIGNCRILTSVIQRPEIFCLQYRSFGFLFRCPTECLLRQVDWQSGQLQVLPCHPDISSLISLCRFMSVDYVKCWGEGGGGNAPRILNTCSHCMESQRNWFCINTLRDVFTTAIPKRMDSGRSALYKTTFTPFVYVQFSWTLNQVQQCRQGVKTKTEHIVKNKNSVWCFLTLL